jgi:hypothetical protein
MSFNREWTQIHANVFPQPLPKVVRGSQSRSENTIWQNHGGQNYFEADINGSDLKQRVHMKARFAVRFTLCRLACDNPASAFGGQLNFLLQIKPC